MKNLRRPNLIKSFLQNARGDNLKARLIRGGLCIASIQAVNRLLLLVLGIVLARALGPDGFGIYAYALAIMALLMVLAEAGVPTLLLREVAARQARQEWGLLRGALRRSGQFVAAAASSITLLGLLVLWWFSDSLKPEVVYTTALMLLVLPPLALLKTVANAMQGLHQVVIGQAVDMLIRPLLVLLIVGVVFFAWPQLRLPHTAMAAQLVGALVVLLIGVLMLRRFLPNESGTAAPEYKDRYWLKSALSFVLIGGAGIINNQTDIIMLGWFMEPKDVGIYRVAVQGATLVTFSLQVTNAIVAPQFSRLYAQGDMETLQLLVTRSAQAILLAALPVALCFMFAGGVIIAWIFGQAFAEAYLPLAILAVGQLINACFGSVGFLLSMTGREAIVTRILWQTALLNIVFNAGLIPFYGVNGAAIATSISLTIWNLLLYLQVKNKLGIISTAF